MRAVERRRGVPACIAVRKALPMPRVDLGNGASVGVRVNTGEAVRVLQDMRDRLSHMRPFYTVLGNILRAAWRRNFQAGGIPAWQPLAPSTIAQKKGMGLPAPGKTGKPLRRLSQNGNFGPDNILIRTGKMRDALCQRGSAGNLTIINDDGGFYGINPDVIPYAAIHEFGGSRWYHIYPVKAKALAWMGGEGYMIFRLHVYHPPLPRRPMTTLLDDDFTKISEAGVEHVQGSGMAGPTG